MYFLLFSSIAEGAAIRRMGKGSSFKRKSNSPLGSFGCDVGEVSQKPDWRIS
jgi:hypothetical protein